MSRHRNHAEIETKDQPNTAKLEQTADQANLVVAANLTDQSNAAEATDPTDQAKPADPTDPTDQADRAHHAGQTNPTPQGMRHRIDPKVDCVFKALLGSETNRALLIHFLNAFLGEDLPAPIIDVEILNPYNEREFLDDKLSVVDVKASDDQGRLHQIEIQLRTHANLTARILYGWADLYSAQLQSGQDYGALKPTYAVWLLGENLLAEAPNPIHVFQMRSRDGRRLVEHGGIWLLELNKFHVQEIETESERWLKFFNEGETLDSEHLPAWMQTTEMMQAMSTLKAFSEKERAYHAYQARQNYQRIQRSIQQHQQALEQALEEERAAKEHERAAKEAALAAQQQERAAKEQERAAKEAALAELARLKASLPPTQED